MIPAKKVAVNANLRYSALFFSGSISLWSIVPRSKDTTATGPMAISLELPIKAYIKGGTKLESEKIKDYIETKKHCHRMQEEKAKVMEKEHI